MRLSILFTLSLCLVFLSPHATAIDMKEHKQIETQRQASNAAMEDHDIDKFVSFFDADYIITYGSSTKVLSLDAETKSTKAMFEDYPEANYVRTPTAIYISEALPLAMENGTWIGGLTLETTYSGGYTAAWRKTDGIWKIHNELFVTLACTGKGC